MAENLYTLEDLAYWYARGAAAQLEHERTWTRLGEHASEGRRQQMMRLFRTCAEDFAERMGRDYVEYRGGPVTW